MYGVEVPAGKAPVWLYLRLSKKHAAEDGADAIERHRLDLMRLLADGPHVAVGEFVDNESASSYAGKARTGWGVLNAAIDAGEVRAVAFKSLSRITRKAIETMQWLDHCRDQAVTLISHEDSAEELLRATGAAKMVTGVKALVNEIESDTISQRQKAAKAHAAEAGFYNGGPPPLGWTTGPRVTDEHGRSGVRLIPHPVEFPALQKAIEWSIAGDGLATISARWRDELGITAADGQPVRQSTILRALRSPRMLGYRLHQVPEHERGVKVDLLQYVVRDAIGQPVISQEPVCDELTWKRLQAVLTERSNASVRRPWGSHEWLLAGMLKCSACGGGMYGSQKVYASGNRSFTYRCVTNRVRGVKTCAGMQIAGPAADAYVYGWLVGHLTPERLAQAKEEARSRSEHDPTAIALADAYAERDLLAQRQKAGQFKGAAMLGAYLDLLNDITDRIAALESLMPTGDPEPADISGPELEAQWPDMTIERRRQVVRRALRHITVHKGVSFEERLSPLPR